IYDLQSRCNGIVYGFIFLFKWIEERRSRRKITPIIDETSVVDEEIVNNMFFAHQVALLSLTPDPQRDNKAALPVSWDDACVPGRAQNCLPEPRHLPEKQNGLSAVRTMEAFHFVSYVPINGRLFELDGLKSYPIDHGPWGEDEEWTEKARRVIMERIGLATGGGQKTNKQEKQNLCTRADAGKLHDGIRDSSRESLHVAVPLPGSTAGAQTHGQSTSRLPPFLDNHNYAKCPPQVSTHFLLCITVQLLIYIYIYIFFQSTPLLLLPKVRLSKGVAPSRNASGSGGFDGARVDDVSETSTNKLCQVDADLSGSLTEHGTFNQTTDNRSSPTPSNESTDTASEIGSAFNSPLRSPVRSRNPTRPGSPVPSAPNIPEDMLTRIDPNKYDHAVSDISQHISTSLLCLDPDGRLRIASPRPAPSSAPKLEPGSTSASQGMDSGFRGTITVPQRTEGVSSSRDRGVSERNRVIGSRRSEQGRYSPQASTLIILPSVALECLDEKIEVGPCFRIVRCKLSHHCWVDGTVHI
uniref:Ubiquitin carboxyl-terminal hydrolase BAP1 n=1 Tax=Eptatretus burgeri TaxID=7764 RepID=A0A8C4QH53_EPTBU